MTGRIDLRSLVERFRESDGDLPAVVFAVLAMYFESDQPVPFDPQALALRLKGGGAGVQRVDINPERLVAIEPDLRKFFDFTDAGLLPKPGVLA